MDPAEQLSTDVQELRQQIARLKQSEAELKKTVSDLRKSEEYFRAITQNASDIIIIVNKKAVVTYINPTIEQFLGYKPEEIIGKSGFDFIIPADIPRALLDFGKSLLTRESKISNSFGIRHKDGSTRILEGVGTNLRRNPVVKGFVMNVHDITDRKKAQTDLETYRRHLEDIVEKRTAELSLTNTQLLRELAERQQAEKALMESEEKYRNFIDYAPIGVSIIDTEGNIQYINKRIEEITGWSREELIGKSGFALKVFDEKSRKLLSERFTARMSGDIPRMLEIPITTKNGNQIWVEVMTCILKKDNKPVGAQIAFANITELKRAEDVLRQSEERFRALIQNSSDVISILDSQGRFVYNSPSAESILGYPDDYLLGKSPFDFIHEDDREILTTKFGNLINKTQKGSTTEFRALRGDGTWRYFESIGNNLLDYPGINGIVLISRDITKRKQAEAERNKLMERLHHSEKMESLGTLAGGVAHDLNNILGVLVGYTELVLMKMNEDDPLRIQVAKIMKSSQRAANIIQDLMTLARRGVSVSEVISLNDVIVDFLKTPEFEKLKSFHPHVTYKSELAGNLLNIKGSPIHVGKTVMNLIFNATEAISGGGEVIIRTDNYYLDKPVCGYNHVREGDYVTLTVSDTGSGITENDRERIFEPFYTKKKMGRSGTGLGLAVVWGTVQDHDGYIDVQSRKDEGSIFIIYFPASREKPATRQQKICMDQYMGCGESILVVDDVEGQREVAKCLLSQLGYQVQSAASGEEAVLYLKKHPVDLLVLDMIMDPGIDGLETYKRILEINPQQKAIIASGYSETERVKEALGLGVGTYVRKPYLLETIGMAIKKTLTAP